MFNAIQKMFQSPVKLPQLDETIAYTPDVARLEQFWLQNVFIYNEFMRGCHLFPEIMEGNVRKLGAAFTKQDNLVLWKKHLGKVSEAFAMEVNEDQRFGSSSLIGEPARILGHVYSMRPDQVMKLDKCHQNGVAFKRKRIKVDVPFNYINEPVDPTNRRVEQLNAWIYIGNYDYWSCQMDPLRKRFSPVKIYKLKGESDPYYFYAQKLEAGRV